MDNYTAPAWLTRTCALIGEDAVKKLQDSSVLLFGCGGVGGFVAEALIRSGVGKLTVVDHDTVSESNLNRQIIADTRTIGREKAELIAERAKSINPAANVTAIAEFADSGNISRIVGEARPDYICDAIDTVTSKLLIISEAKARDIPVISSMGTGNKLDPTRFRIADIKKTSVCPLARAMRHELARLNLSDVEVLFSDEQPVKVGSRVPASVSFVPAAAGLIIAGHIIKKLTGITDRR